MTKVLTVDGMNCAHCVMSVKKALEALGGVRSAVVNLEDGSAGVELTKEVDDQVLIDAVKDAGYGIESVSQEA